MLCSQFSHANSSYRLFLSWNMCTYFWPVPSVQSNKTNTALKHLSSLDSKVLVWNTAQKEALCEKAGQEEKGRFLQLVPKFTATLIGQKNDSWKHHLPRTIKCPPESSSLLLYGMTNLTMWAKTERVKQLTGEPLAFTLREQRRAAATHSNFNTVRKKKKNLA